MTASILDKFFDPQTMSVHIMEQQPVYAKKWKPGGWHMEELSYRFSGSEIQDIIAHLHAECESRHDAFVEIERPHSQVLQLWAYRIVIVRPPLSDILEITVVRPTKKLSLADYELDAATRAVLMDKAKGILIAGAPGEWKTTFAQAFVAELVQKNVIIKTIESPRDLVVDDRIVQYSFSHAPHNDIRDILLLSRPDYTVYDEVRNASDFLLYKDLRLTGIGLIGVMHATRPIDSIQRFLWTIDMWTIPQIVDTVIFIQAGRVWQILTLEQVVKTPAGMHSEDLARPVLQVKELHHDTILYEIYSFGDNVVVMPMDQVEASATKRPSGIFVIAKRYLEEYFAKLLRVRIHVHVVSPAAITIYVPEDAKGKVIGRNGEHIQELEHQLGLSISVRTLEELPPELILDEENEGLVNSTISKTLYPPGKNSSTYQRHTNKPPLSKKKKRR